jgi:hypothetical protein
MSYVGQIEESLHLIDFIHEHQCQTNISFVSWSCQVEGSTANVEIKLEGSGPWSLGQDIQLIYTPGHTEVSLWMYCLFIFL